jgi:LPS-assembly protein
VERLQPNRSDGGRSADTGDRFPSLTIGNKCRSYDPNAGHKVATGSCACYVDPLGLQPSKHSYSLSNITVVRCHCLSSLKLLLCVLSLLILLPDFGRSQESQEAAPQEATPEAAPHSDESAIKKYEVPDLPTPNFKVRPNRPNAPIPGEYDITADNQVREGKVTHFRGNVTIEGAEMVLKADEIDVDNDTHDTAARGHVYFQQFVRNEIIVCERAEYNTDSQMGKFYNLRGYTKTKIDAKPGMLTSDNPFYFEGAWAEKIHEKYILHDGFITGCVMPGPWWTLNGPRFDIIPEDRALAFKAVYRLKSLPLFYTPFFYKSLKKEPRKSGFLTPNFGNSTRLGLFLGVGYYWAINRSYDVLYNIEDFTARGYAHHVDFRGKPTEKSDFDVIFNGVQDRGILIGSTLQKQGGYDIYAAGKADIGNGWTAKGNIDYLSNLLYRQNFTQSFNEAIFSESHSVGYLSKIFDNYNTFNVVASREENFQDNTPGDYILIRKFPEFQLIGRDYQVENSVVPLWVSYDASAGLMYRFSPTTLVTLQNGASYTDLQLQTQQLSQRAYTDPRAMTAFHFAGIHFVPSFTLHEIWYSEQIENQRVEQRPFLSNAREFGLDIILPTIERVYNKKTFFGDKLKHVIEPRITYTYISGLGVGDYTKVIRYDEADLLTNTNQVNISITNRIYAKRGNDTAEIFTWEVAQERYFDPTFGGSIIPGQRNVVMSQAIFDAYTFLDGPRSYSPIVSTMRAPLWNGFNAQWQADYDPLYGRLVDSGFSVDYRRKKYFVSAGQNQVHNNPVLTPAANQLRGTFGVGDANRRGWNAAVNMNYDYTKGYVQYTTATVNYNTDCCGISVQYRHFDLLTRNENQFRVSFSIANIGSFGNLRKQERLF